jgi:hypothetical protein
MSSEQNVGKFYSVSKSIDCVGERVEENKRNSERLTFYINKCISGQVSR